MGNIIIATPELSDAAVLTAGNAAAPMPVTNLQKMQPGLRWGTTNLTNIWLLIDLNSAQPINLIALLAHNASGGATWRIRAANVLGDVTASPAYDATTTMWSSGALINYESRPSIRWLQNSLSYRYWRIDISDPTNPDGVFRAGRLYLSQAWQPSRNLNYDWEMVFVDDSQRQVSLGGQVYIDRRGIRRRLHFTLPNLPESEAFEKAFEIDRQRGASRDMLVAVDPDDLNHLHRQAVYGLAAEIGAVKNTAFNLYEKTYSVEELI